MRQRLARFVIRRMGYTMVGETPSRGILVGAPHTSNWDFVTMLLVMWHDGAHPRVLVKKELFKGPLGWVLRALGGVPLDRRDAGGVVGELAAEARDGEDFRLVIAAEGTRSRGEYWKSGFHRLSRETGLPITLAFFDPPTRTMGYGPTFVASDDVGADMDVVRAFYADKLGIKPANATVPRLREE
ncbi:MULTISPECIES: 1-acyl-sn-glycerol-3-phosphate acyltransferase [unclassified Aeromicrobium]|jgi:1-acyl-sn-glycerol-3-phosphate acyltransferase|uniref:1-acyl-sn-glycerol-3-phosphate acyltransferase n=1 Tax=unclassified Aeromicrobium TaxID=2633570 RepID=UPI002097EB20|nr:MULTISPECIES: 1-acyl-sn-glycerol-3-phosphate acyltransferase [unclassified Aeromicrobium]MCO7240518.1 1-acyl-sn-glycerol-3-phosphate acyltransferase [Aeromicrobium sp. CnD17-E]MDR6118970.1 1-acyl-sn-glycerol-3-phosphate acyltransferase [Aeromicrobium sp. SORGH_AS_0981]